MLTSRTNQGVLAVLLLGGTLLGSCSRTPTAPANAETGGKVESVSLEGKATTGSDSYLITHEGVIVGVNQPLVGRPGVGKNSSQVDMGSCCQGTDQIKLSAALVEALGDCFGPLTEGYTQPIDFVGSIVRDRKDDTVVRGDYWFDANGKGSGSNKTFHYRLQLTGTLTVGPFPPAPDDTAQVEWNFASLETEGKGKGSKGGNENTSCAGSLANPGGYVAVTGVGV